MAMAWWQVAQEGLAAAQKQAQEAANALMQSEAADKARQLAAQATQQAQVLAEQAAEKAAQATQQAKVFAGQATEKAKEVAKEAREEGERALAALRAKEGGLPQAPRSEDPMDYGITHDFEQYVASLTYSTFSDYPQETLPTYDAAQQDSLRLSEWQETHARLILGRVPQLQDLRFVLCPKRMQEYTFWQVYFTLCRRYLPEQSHELRPAEELASSSRGAGEAGAHADVPAGSGAAGAVAAAAAAAGVAAVSLGVAAGGAGGSGALPGAPGDGGVEEGPGSADVGGEDDEDDGVLADLDNDPDLDAYLQEALQDGAAEDDGDEGAGGDEDGDLDEYINQLDAEINDQEEDGEEEDE